MASSSRHCGSRNTSIQLSSVDKILISVSDPKNCPKYLESSKLWSERALPAQAQAVLPPESDQALEGDWNWRRS